MPKRSISYKQIIFILSCIVVISGLLVSGKSLKNKFFPSCVKGSINGQRVTCQDFDAALQKQTVTLKMQYGKLLDQFLPLLKMNERTWQHMKLLSAAKQEGIRVSNQDVINEIAKFEMFFKNGRFDKWVYQYFLRSTLDTKPVIFEGAIRDQLVIKKLFDKVTASAKVTDEEVLTEYRKNSENIQADYISIPIELKTDLPVDEAKMKEYFNQHTKDFFIPNSVKIDYVQLDFPADGGIQKQVEMKYKAKAIMDFYAKSKDFAKAAAQLKFDVKHSDYVNVNNFMTKLPNWPLQLVMEIMDLDKGAIKEPYKIEDKGYVIVKLIDHKAGYQPNYDEVKDEVKQAYLKELNKQYALMKANGIYKQVKDLKTKELFEKTMKTLGFKVNNTGETSKLQFMLTHEIDKDSQTIVMNINQINAVTPPITGAQHVVVLFVNSFTPIDEKKFTEEKKNFAEQLLQTKKEQQFEEYTKKITE